jgi:GrpB-like predicted nucleotidyltransferase (UPF0157 family)
VSDAGDHLLPAMEHRGLETGVIGDPESADILIADYQPAWLEKFEVHAAVLAAALGRAALRIEHIGSTSVPGLAAKAIIDILVVVKDSADEASYLPMLEAADYSLRVREPDFHEHRMFRTRARDVHVHVLSDGCPEIERYLTFRERLRNSPSDRQLYEETKRRLAAQSWPSMDAYAQAKSAIVEHIIAAARSTVRP